MNDSGSPAAAQGLCWYALHTRHQHEKTVVFLLENEGFEVFLPLYTSAHRRKDRVKQVSLPLFSCYVFLRGGLDRWLQVATTPGVHGVVGSRGRAAVIPQAEVESIRQAVQNSLQLEPHPFLKDGDWVRVKSGPLAGIEGILVRKRNLFRLVLSVEMLGRSACVEVDVCTVEKVPSPNVRTKLLTRDKTLHVLENRIFTRSSSEEPTAY